MACCICCCKCGGTSACQCGSSAGCSCGTAPCPCGTSCCSCNTSQCPCGTSQCPCGTSSCPCSLSACSSDPACSSSTFCTLNPTQCTTVCCCPFPIPKTLHATVSGAPACWGVNGTYTLTWVGDVGGAFQEWQYNSPSFSINLRCGDVSCAWDISTCSCGSVSPTSASCTSSSLGLSFSNVCCLVAACGTEVFCTISVTY